MTEEVSDVRVRVHVQYHCARDPACQSEDKFLNGFDGAVIPFNKQCAAHAAAMYMTFVEWTCSRCGKLPHVWTPSKDVTVKNCCSSPTKSANKQGN